MFRRLALKKTSPTAPRKGTELIAASTPTFAIMRQQATRCAEAVSLLDQISGQRGRQSWPCRGH